MYKEILPCKTKGESVKEPEIKLFKIKLFRYITKV